MGKKRKKETVQYRLHDIKELEILVPHLSNELVDDFQQDQLGFGFTFDYTWDLEEDIFSVIITVVYQYPADSKEDGEELLKFTGQVDYKIANLPDFIDEDNTEVHLPIELLAVLTGISISTVRGMIATRTFGKFQGNFYLPILDPGHVVKNYFQSVDEQELEEEAN